MTTTPPVTFDFPTFIGLFPEFGSLDTGQCAAYFMRATATIIANSCTNPANADGNLPYLIYLATAHVAWLSCQKDASGNPTSAGAPASPIVGRISSASEGSVSVSAELNLGEPGAMSAYLSQTKYGLELWTALAPYRTARYLARPTIVVGGRFFGSLYNRLR